MRPFVFIFLATLLAACGNSRNKKLDISFATFTFLMTGSCDSSPPTDCDPYVKITLQDLRDGESSDSKETGKEQGTDNDNAVVASTLTFSNEKIELNSSESDFDIQVQYEIKDSDALSDQTMCTNVSKMTLPKDDTTLSNVEAKCTGSNGAFQVTVGTITSKTEDD